MHRNTKIATCCYCGTRAALVLDAGRHELVCKGCGAPLHEIKAMPVGQGGTPRNRGRREAGRSDAARRETGPIAAAAQRVSPFEQALRPGKLKDRKRKRKTSMSKRFFKEAFDLIEDIFD